MHLQLIKISQDTALSGIVLENCDLGLKLSMLKIFVFTKYLINENLRFGSKTTKSFKSCNINEPTFLILMTFLGKYYRISHQSTAGKKKTKSDKY